MNLLVISNDDKTWLLPAWSKFESGFYPGSKVYYALLPDRLTSYNRQQTLFWAFKVFGWKQASLLSFFSVLRILRYFNQSRVIAKNALKISQINVDEILQYISKFKIDAVVITCSYIIPVELLEKSNVPWINKHSSLLPNCRGLFPYIWGKIHGFPSGVTYHLINQYIDQGELLFQKRIRGNKSLVEFYSHIFDYFPQDCKLAIEIAVGNLKRILDANVGPEVYFSLPDKNDLDLFYASGGKIITFKDLTLLYK